MALGRSQIQRGFDDPRVLLGDRLREGSLYRLLAGHGRQTFPDDYFADLYTGSVKGRPTVAAGVVGTVVLLQAFGGLSGREACDRLEVDLGWQAAAGVDAGCRAFHPTVLVGIARKVGRDRVISTVDTQARHGHKSRHRRFDGYKAHLPVDPDSALTDQVAASSPAAPGAGGKPAPAA
jgi:hypothetical protein